MGQVNTGTSLLLSKFRYIKVKIYTVVLWSGKSCTFISNNFVIFLSAFIIFDTQMIMTRVSPEDYIMATIQLYLDIINLFIEILRILNHANRR